MDIIKGKEEAGLAWIAANYLHGTFAPHQDSKATLISNDQELRSALMRRGLVISREP